MSAVHQLTSQNFRIVGTNRKTLNITAPGILLVFFKMAGCPGCAQFEPVFYQLPNIERRVNYAIVDLSQQRDVVKMSRSTVTPIDTVPFIMLYADGRPRAKYTGKKRVQDIQAFLNKILPQLRQNFTPQQNFAPQRGQSGFVGQAPPQAQPKVYMPEMDRGPSLQGIVRGDGSSNYSYLGDIEEEDEEKLSVPEQVTPHNTPWEGGYRKMGGTMD